MREMMFEPPLHLGGPSKFGRRLRADIRLDAPTTLVQTRAHRLSSRALAENEVES